MVTVSGDGAPRQRLRSDPLGETETSSPAPPPVGGFVANDGEEPGAKRGFRAEPGHGSIGLDKRLLGDVLGLGVISDQEIGQSERVVLVYPHQLLECTLITPAGVVQESCLVQWTALHRWFMDHYTG